MEFQTVLVTLAIAGIAYAIFNNTRNIDPKNKACANEFIDLLRNNPHSKAAEMTLILQEHQRTIEQASKVSAMVKASLHKARISKENQTEVMLEVRKAVQLYTPG